MGNKAVIEPGYKAILKKLIDAGLAKAAGVIQEMVNSSVELNVIDIYPIENIKKLPLFSNKVVIQELYGGLINGKSVFSMRDEELLKLLRHLEVINNDEDYYNSENLDLILDTYLEIGNIILGNIISTTVNKLDTNVEIKLPYLADDGLFDDTEDEKNIIVDISFRIDMLDANGKLCLFSNILNLRESDFANID